MGLRRESFPKLLCILRERNSQKLGILEEEWEIIFVHTRATELAKEYSASSEKGSLQKDRRKNHIMYFRNSFHARAGFIGERLYKAQVVNELFMVIG